MNKTIGYELIIEVNGFSDARGWINRLVRAGVAKCTLCANAATHVSWTDQAEWYPHCEDHRDDGEQWTGSTRWNPSSFGINVLKDAARAWFDTLEPFERHKIRFSEYDATDYYSLMTDTETRHYLIGSPDEWHKVFADVTLLTTGEYVYQVCREWSHKHSGTAHWDAIEGVWGTEAEALEAARVAVQARRNGANDGL